MSEDRERWKPEFKFNPDGVGEQQKVNPHISVIDQFYPEHEDSLKDRTMEPVKSRRDIDKLLEKNPLQISLSVSDQLNDAGAESAEVNVDLSIKSLKDFTPGGIAQRVRESKGESNRELRTALNMLDAARLVQARLKAGSTKDTRFILDVVKAAAKKLNQGEPAKSHELRQQVEAQAGRTLLNLVKPPKAPKAE